MVPFYYVGRNLNPKAACLKRREEKSQRGGQDNSKPFSLSLYTSYEKPGFEYEESLGIRHRQRAQSLPTPTLKKKVPSFPHKVDHSMRKHIPVMKKSFSKPKNSLHSLPPPTEALLPPINSYPIEIQQLNQNSSSEPQN